MAFLDKFNDNHLPLFGKNWRHFSLWGICLIVLGIWAIFAATMATIVSVVVLGFVIFFSGIVMLIDSITFWRDKWSGFGIQLILSILYILVGLMLINNPIEGSVSITLLLGILYVFAGIFRILFSSAIQLPQWGWVFSNGIVTLILGILILASWPASSLYIIGLFIGIDLIFCGWGYLMAGMAAKKYHHA
jgi:uncharacterized membrane protein HdeD (DUF308 family)